jgi:hypothetical protein
LKRWLWTLCAGLVVGACGEESPTGVGAGLLPQDAIRTFEVVLDAERYLVFDTAFSLFSAPSDAEFGILANAFEGVLHSRILTRFGIPRSIQVVDSAGLERTEQNPVFIGGEVQIVIDTVAVQEPGQVQLYHTTESWDRLTANWTLRVDSPGVQTPWSQPGGSPGPLIQTAVYEQGADTVRLPIDSATIAAWADTSNAARGALLTMASPDSRLRTGNVSLVLRAISAQNPDTVFEARVTPPRTFIFTPELAEQASMLRVGGVPSWRGVLRLRERLDTVTVACPDVPDCRLRLGDVSISRATLLLQPAPPPPGYAPELSITMTAHLMLPSPLVPLQRSPLTEALAALTAGIPPASFREPLGPAVEMPLTDVFASAFARAAEGADPAQRPSHIALLQAGNRTFGIAQFLEMPRLRLILSIAQELQLP